jgi:hypothetical protein
MKKRIMALLLVTHAAVGILGFLGGIYILPVLIAPPAPADAMVEQKAAQAMFTGQFKRDLQDSDVLHWGEGTLFVGSDFIAMMGRVSPGPDYKLYLSTEFVETETEFRRLKSSMIKVADVKTFENFVIDLPAGINPSSYSSAIVWCETFDQFITAAKYR